MRLRLPVRLAVMAVLVWSAWSNSPAGSAEAVRPSGTARIVGLVARPDAGGNAVVAQPSLPPQFAGRAAFEPFASQPPQRPQPEVPPAGVLSVQDVPTVAAGTNPPVAMPLKDHSSGEDAIAPLWPQGAAALSDRGWELAQRGMYYAAQEELVKALELVAKSGDAHFGPGSSTAALACGLANLEVEQQLSSAQEELARVLMAAAGPGSDPTIASQILYRLGRVRASLASQKGEPHGLRLAQATALYQAALSVDERNYLAAHELGYLLARNGAWAEARQHFLHSLSIQPQVETWHNLAAVHRRLREDDLARRAEAERDRLARATRPQSAGTGDVAQHVRFRSFESHAREIPWPDKTVATAARGGDGTTRR